MSNFDGNDLVTRILQMEQYFDLHNVKNTQKVCIATLYLKQNTFVWYRWLFSRKKIVTWSIFMKEMIAHYEDKKEKHLLYPIDKYQTKGFNGGAHGGCTKIEYKDN